MFVTPAYAQAADAGVLGQGGMLIPLVLIFVIMYFLIIRPQRAQMKKHQEMVNATRRGDTVVTAGGLIGKVTKVFDEVGEVEVEIADGVRVRVVRTTLTGVRSKGEPVSEKREAQPKKKGARKGKDNKATSTSESSTKTTDSGEDGETAETPVDSDAPSTNDSK